MNAVGCTGLQLYSFGEAVSLVFFTETWRPDSFYDKIAANRASGLHTLVLLDIKVKEPNMAMLARGKTVYEAPRFMTIAQAVAQMLEIEDVRGEGVYSADTLAVGVARVGQKDQLLRAGSLAELQSTDFGGAAALPNYPGTAAAAGKAVHRDVSSRAFTMSLLKSRASRFVLQWSRKRVVLESMYQTI
eukprot:CAMPEP_0185839464 /NCGR_PEP_ID=MMETSP1353-20130828/14621_1 /TAXON_ID=1077150 /ORGANISM="Erythrolobus australicus, Strain CCMP3124" /LENGTH=187 /DNA_ID=CAMNT_0028538635 /DNA_START=199 /DNA_END=761 /DNA_ORIENTATION=-